MKFHYDTTGAEPIIRDTRVYDASVARGIGTLMAAGLAGTAEATGCAVVARVTILDNIIGVLMEDLTAAQILGVVATGVDKYGKILINPFAIWLTEYSMLAADDSLNTSADTSGKVLTATMVTDHERGWAYVTNVGSTTGGYGNLFQIGAATTTTSITAATDYDNNLLGTNTSDTFIVMPAPYSADVAGYGIDLATNAKDLAGYGGTGAGAAIVVESYIASAHRPLEALVAAKHSGYNYKSEAPKFYGDVWFPEHLFATGGVVNNRVIT